MGKFTPGMWIVDYCTPHGSGDGYHRVLGADGEVVCDFPGEDTDMEAVYAQLMAAAPALLQCVKDLVPIWESGIDEPWVAGARALVKRLE